MQSKCCKILAKFRVFAKHYLLCALELRKQFKRQKCVICGNWAVEWGRFWRKSVLAQLTGCTKCTQITVLLGNARFFSPCNAMWCLSLKLSCSTPITLSVVDVALTISNSVYSLMCMSLWSYLCVYKCKYLLNAVIIFMCQFTICNDCIKTDKVQEVYSVVDIVKPLHVDPPISESNYPLISKSLSSIQTTFVVWMLL